MKIKKGITAALAAIAALALAACGSSSSFDGSSSASGQSGSDSQTIVVGSEGDMRMMLLLWDATPGNGSLKIVEIPIKATLNNPDFPEK